jgi:hypothetical protein
MLALCLGNNFSEHPAITALLQRTTQVADYLKEMSELPQNFWSEPVTS